MIALVTGASGAIGAHLAQQLLVDGHEVISVLHDLKPTDTASLLGIRNQITWIPGDLCEESFCRRIVADYGPDAIFHLAALPLVQVATRTTVPIFETNIRATINLLEAVKENAWAGKEIRFVYLDSDKSYGDAGEVAYREDMPLNPLAIYDVSKAAASMVCRAYARSELVPKLIIGRCCNIITPGDLNFGRVVPRTILPCLRGSRPVLYRTTYRREFIGIKDAVQGLLHLERSIRFGGADNDNAFQKTPFVNGEVYNIGSGEQLTLDEVVNLILAHFPGIEPIWTEPPKLTRVEIPFQKLDTAKIRRTGWTPTETVKESITKCVEWWKRSYERLPRRLRERKIESWHG